MFAERRAQCGVIVAGDFNMECPNNLFSDSLGLKHVFGVNDVPFTHKWGEGAGAFLSHLDQVYFGGCLKPYQMRDCFSSEVTAVSPFRFFAFC